VKSKIGSPEVKDTLVTRFIFWRVMMEGTSVVCHVYVSENRTHRLLYDQLDSKEIARGTERAILSKLRVLRTVGSSTFCTTPQAKDVSFVFVGIKKRAFEDTAARCQMPTENSLLQTHTHTHTHIIPPLLARCNKP
jgi:hypothetical protein